MNEDVAWQRLQDIQREMENRRLLAAGQPNSTFETIKQLAARVWLLAALAVRTGPRRNLRRGTARTTLATWKLRSPNR
jgi:hypothetical protein